MHANTLIIRKVRWLMLGLLVLVLAWHCSAAPKPKLTKPSGAVLILHDASGPYGWIGGLHARMMANLLGHFKLSYRIVPVESYRAGDVKNAIATFYLGTTYDNPLPPALLRDTRNTSRPMCWFKYNLWQLASAPATARRRLVGIRVETSPPPSDEAPRPRPASADRASERR